MVTENNKQLDKSRTNIILILAPVVTWILALICLILGFNKYIIYRNDPANQIIIEPQTTVHYYQEEP